MGSDELSYPFEVESPAETEDQGGSSHWCHLTHDDSKRNTQIITVVLRLS